MTGRGDKFFERNNDRLNEELYLLQCVRLQALALVPNHLSTQKTTNIQPPYYTRIRHYSLLFTLPTSKLPLYTRVVRRKEGLGRKREWQRAGKR